MAFDQAAIEALYSQITSPFKRIGAFRSVVENEPLSAPTALPAVALWWGGSPGIGPARGLSGLAATSARVEFQGRIYTDATKRPADMEVQLMRLASLFIGVFTSGFTLGGEAMEVDLLGSYGAPLSATPGWIVQDDHQFRVAECLIPIIADGLWVQVP